MRTIKFRGKRIDSGKWIYGDLHTHDCTEIIVHDGYRAESYYPVDPDTVGQFTGLHDKNGKEIYEGDIIKYTRYKIHSDYFKKDFIANYYVVYWNEGKHSFYCTTRFEHGGGASGFLNFHDERAEKNEIEVVGNRYDNPELMEGGEK